MTEQPPPPPPGGTYPPPPDSAGGYAPPPPGPVVRGLPRQAYTSWIARVLAFVIDRVVGIVLAGVAVFSSLPTRTCATSFSTTELTVLLATPLVALAYLIWNFGYRQGTTGSSIGKSAMKFKVVSEDTGQPIGFWLSVLRQLAHFVDAIIVGIGYLFPLWDAKRQTLADKIMSTVCLPRR